MLLLFAVIYLGACASTPEVTESPVKTRGEVPGEKTSDEPMSATAGPGGVGAGMRW
jgi:hypothetical protein